MVTQVLLCSILAFSAMTLPLAATVKKEKLYSKIAHLPKQPIIRVEMMADIEGAKVEVQGTHNIYDPKTAKKVESVYQSSGYYMHPTVEGLKWGEEFPGIFQLLLVPDSAKTPISLAGIPLRGMLACYQLEGSLGFVNELSIDDFVESLLSTELSQNITQREALAAMAILLRTDALYAAKHPKNKQYWDIKADECGYKGNSVVRQDAAFVDAMKTSQDMVLLLQTDNDSFGVRGITAFAKDDIVRKGEECERLAIEGKDARAILEAIFPKGRIALAQDIKKYTHRE